METILKTDKRRNKDHTLEDKLTQIEKLMQISSADLQLNTMS